MGNPFKLDDGWGWQALAGLFTIIVIPLSLWAVNAEYRIREAHDRVVKVDDTYEKVIRMEENIAELKKTSDRIEMLLLESR